jgi:Tfp pilus assembly protein PilF
MDGTRTRRAFYAFWLLPALLAAACGHTAPQRLEDTSDFHLQLAYGDWQAGQVPQAIEELQTALAIDPRNADAHYMLGFVFSGRNMFNEAIQHYRQALLLRPNWYEVKNNLGAVFLELERWEEAAAIFEELTQVPEYHTPGHAYNNLGWAQLNMGQTSEALANFQMATYLQPDLCLAYNNQGITLVQLHREQEAEAAFQEAIDRCATYAEPRFRLARTSRPAPSSSSAPICSPTPTWGTGAASTWTSSSPALAPYPALGLQISDPLVSDRSSPIVDLRFEIRDQESEDQKSEIRNQKTESGFLVLAGRLITR